MDSGIARPIRALAEKSREIAMGNYQQRVTTRAKNEIGELAHNFNVMSGAIELSVAQLKKAAHENHLLFVNSVRMLAGDWRTRTRSSLGEGSYKGIYSLASLLGFALIVWGFGVARQQPVQLWSPPVALRHVAALLTLISFVLLAAAYVPGNGIKARVHHPMVLGVKVWALSHLLVNGNVAHVVLYGSFLAWSVWNFVASRRRDRVQGVQYGPARASATVITLVAGLGFWLLFALLLLGWLIGVKPFG